jgi:hypothetical protein
LELPERKSIPREPAFSSGATEELCAFCDSFSTALIGLKPNPVMEEQKDFVVQIQQGGMR